MTNSHESTSTKEGSEGSSSLRVLFGEKDKKKNARGSVCTSSPWNCEGQRGGSCSHLISRVGLVIKKRKKKTKQRRHDESSRYRRDATRKRARTPCRQPRKRDSPTSERGRGEQTALRDAMHGARDQVRGKAASWPGRGLGRSPRCSDA